MALGFTHSMFMCQDEDENENQSFGSFWNLCMTNEPILHCIIVLRAQFVRHRLDPERTKTFVFGFVLAHEQVTTLSSELNNRLLQQILHFFGEFIPYCLGPSHVVMLRYHIHSTGVGPLETDWKTSNLQNVTKTITWLS